MASGRRVLPRRWPVRSRLYWCPERNVPLLAPSTESAFEVPLGEPGDARPAFKADHQRLRDAIAYEMGGDELYRRAFEGRLVILNRIPYMDEMKEVIVDGGLAGKLYFDPFKKRWRFRFSRWSARMAIELGYDKVYKLGPGEKPRPIVEVLRDWEEDSQVIIVSSSGEPLAIGYYRGRAIHLQTRLGGEKEPLEGAKPSTIHDALKANEYELYKLKARAITFLSVMHDKLRGKPVVVSYSGGKDSLVALHLSLESGLEPELLFNDTGIELPETVETAWRTAERLGLELRVASAGDAFWRGVEVYGPPAKDYRWCCKVIKLAPLARLTKELWPGGALNVVGLRAFESFDRARNPRVWRNRWMPHLLSVTPIREWSQLAVWLYVFKHGLDYNPLYELGYERLGCYPCPASTLAEYKVIEVTHPELWRRWVEVLEKWRRVLGMPREWVEYGLWRWHGPAGQKERIARRLGLELRRYEWKPKLSRWAGAIPRILERSDARVVIELGRRGEPRALEAQARVLGARIVEVGEGRAVLESPAARIELRDGVLAVTSKGELRGDRLLEEALDALKLLYRWWMCVGCGACEVTCPRGAARLVGGKPVALEGCVGCRICVDTCPAAEVYFEHVVAPLLLGRVDARKRETKRRMKEVIELEKKLHGVAATEEAPREPVSEIPASLWEAEP